MELRLRAAALAAPIATILALACGASAGAETRDPSLWPFAASSPWNSSLGSGAQYPNGTCDAAVRAEADNSDPPWINTRRYGIPLYWAVDADPLKTVYEAASPRVPLPSARPQGRFRIPHEAAPDPGSDRSLVVYEPGHAVSDEMLLAYPNAWWVNTVEFSRHDLVGGDGFRPLIGFGPRAAGASFVGGLMRGWELEAGTVRHALALALTPRRMAKAAVPPATAIDHDHRDYAGPVPMGQLVTLAPGVSVDALGLTSPAGRAIALALQNYGAYVVDTSDALTLYAEPGARSLVAAAHTLDERGDSDMKRIVRQLSCVSNNSGPAWGGGGAPKAPPAPPFE